jgi:mono/diheme cytochrome c family protein
MYSRLSDGETAALIAWIRAQPRRRGETEGVRPGPLGRFAVATGRFKSSADKIAQFRTQAPIMLGPQLAAGRRLAANTCSECHGPALFGQRMEGGEVTPDLAIVGAYDPEQFRTLLRTGRAPHKRDLGLMARVARGDFRHFSDEEIDALYAYLKGRAERTAS